MPPRTASIPATLLLSALLVPLSALASAGDAPAGSEPPDPQHHHAAPAQAQVPAESASPTRPWPTDAPLRDGMARIEAAHRAALGGDPGRGGELAATIDASIASMIANCRLAPDADAALHPILGELGRAASALRGRPGDAGALADVAAALQAYARQFDHPGFPATSG